jgi:hypothetical protein
MMIYRTETKLYHIYLVELSYIYSLNYYYFHSIFFCVCCSWLHIVVLMLHRLEIQYYLLNQQRPPIHAPTVSS